MCPITNLIGFLFRPAPYTKESAKVASLATGRQNSMIMSPESPGFARRRKEEREYGWGKYVPYMMIFSLLPLSFGVGITVAFFEIFWRVDFELTPSQVMVIGATYFWIMSFFNLFMERVSRKFGRGQVMFVGLFVASICFVIMSQTKNVYLFLVVYFLRGGFCNGCEPIRDSIISDYTPPSQRGRWNTG